MADYDSKDGVDAVFVDAGGGFGARAEEEGEDGGTDETGADGVKEFIGEGDLLDEAI